jgi:predicted permease
MTGLFTGLRNSVKTLARRPVLTVLCVATLALGIGGNTAVFSVVNAVLLKPLAFTDPERLFALSYSAPGLGLDTVDQAASLHYTFREENQAFDDIGMWDTGTVTVTGIDDPRQVSALVVTEGTLSLLGIRPRLGRLFTAEDDSPGSQETVILSHGYWQRRYGGDPGVIGQTLTVDGRPQEIIGVLRADLQFLDHDPELFFPFQYDPGELYIGQFNHMAVARLRTGVTVEQATQELARLIPVAMERFPPPPGLTIDMMREARVTPHLRPLKEDVVGDVGNVLWVVLGTVGLVLLVACANVANLFLLWAEGRQRELAIRTALGASRGRLTGEFLRESVMLGVVAGIVGLWIAWAAIQLLVLLKPEDLPRLDEISIDATVLAFNLAVSVVAGLAFGLVPVMKLKTANVVGALKEGGREAGSGRERNRARSALVVSQIAVALVLLIGSGLMIRSFIALRKVDPGFKRPEEVLTLQITVLTAEVEEPLEVVGIHEEILSVLGGIPGVESVGAVSTVSMAQWTSADPMFVEGLPTEEGELAPIRRNKWVLPGYFETMENPVLAGRAITWADVHDRAPVAVVTDNLARAYWDTSEDALGNRIRPNPNDPWREIVGVVGDVRDDGVDQDAVAIVFWPVVQEDFWDPGVSVRRTMTYVIRSHRVGTTGLMDDARSAVKSVSPNLPADDVRTLEDILHRSMARTSFTLVMLGIAAGVALLLGVVGIYGVTSYAVSLRTREIGVRMALGAQKHDVIRLVLGHGLVLAGFGVVAGLAAAVALTRLMSGLLYGVRPLDPVTYAAVAVALGAIVLAASYLPARRAAGVEPMEALRTE